MFEVTCRADFFFVSNGDQSTKKRRKREKEKKEKDG